MPVANLDVRAGSFHLRVQRMERIYRQADGEADTPHSHDYYTLLWVQEGEGEHLVDFQRYALAPQQVYFVAPRQVHQVITKSEPKGWVVTFSRLFLAQNHIDEDFITEINLFSPFDQRPPIALPAAQQTQVEWLFEHLLYWYNKPINDLRIAALSANLKLLLVLFRSVCILPDVALEHDHGGRELLKAFKKLLDDGYQQTHKVADYAEQLHVSTKHLNQVVRTLLGQTAKEIIQEKITINAQRALRYSDYNIKEIAYDLGFDDPLYFSAFFKKCTGLTPTDFRRSKS